MPPQRLSFHCQSADFKGHLAGMTGLEPIMSQSKCDVLPLHHIPISDKAYYINIPYRRLLVHMVRELMKKISTETYTHRNGISQGNGTSPLPDLSLTGTPIQDIILCPIGFLVLVYDSEECLVELARVELASQHVRFGFQCWSTPFQPHG